MTNVVMRANGLDTIECDSCKKHARLDSRGTEPSHWYGLIDCRYTDDTGTPRDEDTVDFCSLACLLAWASHQKRASREGEGSTANEVRCMTCGNPGEYSMNAPAPLGWVGVDDADDHNGTFCRIVCLTKWATSKRPKLLGGMT